MIFGKALKFSGSGFSQRNLKFGLFIFFRSNVPIFKCWQALNHFLRSIIGTNKMKRLSYGSFRPYPAGDSDGGVLWLTGTLLYMKWSNQISPCKTSPEEAGSLEVQPEKAAGLTESTPLFLLPEADHLHTLSKYVSCRKQNRGSGPCAAPPSEPHQGPLVSLSHPQGPMGPTVKAQYGCTKFPGIYHSRSYFNKNNWEVQNSPGDFY